MIIRPEIPADHAAIHDLTARAFAPMPYSNGSEPRVIEALRQSGDLTLSLVAFETNTVLGQITFSPVTIEGVHDHWFGLGPVAVEPDRQSEGIGGKLIREGLNHLEEMGAKGCVLVGNPAYYSRFGFEGDVGLVYSGLDPVLIQRLTFSGDARQGKLLYSPAFERAARQK